ncbi:MAG: hypothetical protein ACI88H_000596 [Cocleimonas sp.]|jgi:hypothetical protein
MDIDKITELFQWMTVINIGLLLFSTFAVITMKPLMLKMHSKMFGVSEAQISTIVYAYLGGYKVLIIVFNIIPFIALLIVN